MRSEGLDGFLYAPVPLDMFAKSRLWQRVHDVGIIFFYPVWYIDNVFGGPSYGYPPMVEIDKPD